MPIEYRVDHDERRVLAEGHGAVSSAELFQYQRDVWSRADVAGYDELMDMTGVTSIAGDTPEGMRSLAELAARSDPAGSRARFAIVAPQESTFGLARMYETYRGLEERSTKKVAVFRDRDEALKWLSRGESR
jgi:hypothetical protein